MELVDERSDYKRAEGMKWGNIQGITGTEM